MGTLGNFTDVDMMQDFVSWIIDYEAYEVLDARDESAQHRILAQSPEYVWIEVMHDVQSIIPLITIAESDRKAEILGEFKSEVMNLRFYLCGSEFTDEQAGSDSWILTGATFACDACQMGDPPEEDCPLCNGEGGAFLSVHHEDVREELEEMCDEAGTAIPEKRNVIGF